MKESEKTKKNTSFYLNKWYFDFIGENGEAMIFYAAELILHGIRIPYTSWLNCSSDKQIENKWTFKNLVFPELEQNEIIWKHPGFKIDGSWKKISPSVEAAIFESPEGKLDWFCYQPASDVQLNISGKQIIGKGYAERLILTLPVWKIPMKQLRWGHIISKKHQLVWIEIINSHAQKMDVVKW